MVPEGGIGEIDLRATPTGDDQNVTTIIAIRWKTDNDRLTVIRTVDDLIDRPTRAPGRLTT